MSPTETKRLRVLLVDDEPFVMNFYIEDLRNDNMEVDFCDSAKKAREKLAGSYDVAVLDLMMPTEELQNDNDTGLYLFKEFRQFHPQTPVMILTNRSVDDKKLIEAFRTEPFVKVIPKIKILPSEFPREVRLLATLK